MPQRTDNPNLNNETNVSEVDVINHQQTALERADSSSQYIVPNPNTRNSIEQFLDDLYGDELPVYFQQLLSTQYSQGNMELPFITAIGNVVPVDAEMIQALNGILTTVPDHSLFLRSIYDPGNYEGIARVFQLLPGLNHSLLEQVYGGLTEEFRKDLLFMFFMVCPNNSALFSYIHDLTVAVPDVRTGLVLNGQIISHIVNIFMYYVANIAPEHFDALTFQNELITAYMRAYEYNYSIMSIQGHLETTTQFSENYRQASLQSEIINELSQNTILENRDSANDDINALSNSSNRSWVMNTVAFTCLNLLLLNQLGFIPASLLEQVSTTPFMSVFENSRDQLVSTAMDNPVQIRDIYNLILEKLYRFLSER